MLLMSLAAVDSSLYRLAHSVCHSWKASSCRCNQVLQMQTGATDQHGQHATCKRPTCEKPDMTTFQTRNDCWSTTVGWMISLPGNTPHVTALASAEPCNRIAQELAQQQARM